MAQRLIIPHRKAHGLCPVNGIRDLIQHRTCRDWSNEFVHGLGQGGGFAYLRFNSADPPRQVYWGSASPRQHKYLAELFGASYTELENRTFKYAWKTAQDSVDSGTPPILGPLDMFHLHFYPGIYQQRHIPIHYLLLVGYDLENAYVHDTGLDNIQTIPLNELEQAWNVSVPGLGKRNRLVTLSIPQDIPSTKSIICKSIMDECKIMLNPPVSMLGIPAMEKLAGEIANWPHELGKKMAGKSLRQVREYLNSPPDLMGGHLTAGRDIYIKFMQEAEGMTGLNLSAATARMNSAMEIIPKIAEAIHTENLCDAAACFRDIAGKERDAFRLMMEAIEPSL